MWGERKNKSFIRNILGTWRYVLYAGIFCFWFFFILGAERHESDIKEGYIRIGEESFYAEIADTAAERTQGLSGRTDLPQGTGLFFIFDAEDRYGFWMKDMHFPIDIVWINGNFRVVDITYNIDPDTFPTSFFPSVPAQFVFEVNAGEAVEIKIGDPVVF